MATLGEIRQAIKATVEPEAVGLKVYPRIPGSGVSRCLVVRPATSDFVVVMKKGFDTWNFDLVVLLATGDLDVAQAHLDDYIDGGGDKSIRAAIFQNKTLGLADTDAHISGLVGYGPFDFASYDHVGGILRLVVTTKPS